MCMYFIQNVHFIFALVKKYDIKKNKGYGTKKHLEAIEKYGIMIVG